MYGSFALYGAQDDTEEAPVNRTAAEVLVDAAKIAERTLHVGARGVVFVEELGFVDSFHARASTSAEFFEPKAIVLQTAASIAAWRPTSGT